MRAETMKSSITILVVDDEVMMRDLMMRILTRDRYQVVTAEDGRAALEALRQQKIDLIVTDMKMPRMNGFELLRIVKKEYPEIALIMMTAYGDTYTVKDALLLGADEYLIKPFKSLEVSLIVERAYWRILSASHKVEKTLPRE